MEKYSTPKKIKDKTHITNTQTACVEDTVNKAVWYVDQWTKKELLAMVANKSTSPLCIPVGKSGYLIGKYKIKPVNNFWVAQDIFNNTKHVFSSKIVAVIYTLCDHQGHHKIANEILTYDTEIIKILEDLTIYTHLKKSAKVKHDTWRVDHYSIMETSAMFKLEDVKKQLEKSLHLAKYFKIQ
jgi:hypothetical protein